MVIQAVTPWISNDIAKGARWSPEISDRLSQSKIGIFCLTPENLHSDWILFEAGAISKIKNNHVCTFLYNLNPADIEQPLAQFQHTVFSREDVKKLIGTINEEIEHPLVERTLDSVFEKNWPDLEKQLKSISPSSKTDIKKAERPDREILEEILELTRRLSDNALRTTSIQVRPISEYLNEKIHSYNLNDHEGAYPSEIKKKNLKTLLLKYPELNKYYKIYTQKIIKEKEPKILVLDTIFKEISASNALGTIPSTDIHLFLDSL